MVQIIFELSMVKWYWSQTLILSRYCTGCSYVEELKPYIWLLISWYSQCFLDFFSTLLQLCNDMATIQGGCASVNISISHTKQYFSHINILAYVEQPQKVKLTPKVKKNKIKKLVFYETFSQKDIKKARKKSYNERETSVNVINNLIIFISHEESCDFLILRNIKIINKKIIISINIHLELHFTIF